MEVGYCVYISLLVICVSGRISANSLVVSTTHGKVRGKTVLTHNNTKVDVWWSIPFAKPPVDELRFKHPVPPDNWNEIRDTTGIPNTCYQKAKSIIPELMPNDWLDGSKISEDCLYLSVVTPNPRPNKAAVIVWFFGGANSFGSTMQKGFEYDILASYGNVILVVPQFRLSAFGFLYGGDSEAPGNAGIYDQLLALNWVKDNIAKFGGDPDRVTLSGISSGAGTIGMHLTSPKSTNLFSRAILLSGSPNMNFGSQTTERAYGVFMNLAKSVNCYKENGYTSIIVDCLRKKSAAEIESHSYLGFFQPVPDGKIVLGVGSKMLDHINVTPKKEILLGSTTEDAAIALHISLPDIIKFEEHGSLNESEFERAVRRLFSYLSPTIQDVIIYTYKNWDDPNNSMKNLKSLIKLYTDYLTKCELERFTEFASKADWKIYKYLFGYRIKGIIESFDTPKWTGAFAGVANAFFQGYGYHKGQDKTSMDDKLMAQFVMKSFSNFAKTGNPNTDEDGTLIKTHWGPYTDKTDKGERRFLNMSNQGINFEEHGKLIKECVMWQKIIPLFNKLSESKNKPTERCNDEANVDIDGSSLDPDTILTITKVYQTSIVNPKVKHSFNLHQAILNSNGDIQGETTDSGFPGLIFSKTNTTTRIFNKANKYTTEQNSKTLSTVKKH